MIYTHIAYDLDRNLGAAYNRFMELLGEDDWACFLDHDAMFTTEDWYKQLDALTEQFPLGTFYGVTNRVGNYLQVVNEKGSWDNHDIWFHREVGAQKKTDYGTSVTPFPADDPRFLSGVVILVSKRTWVTIGGVKDGFLGVDNDLHKKCNKHELPVYMMHGVYVYHWFRGDKHV